MVVRRGLVYVNLRASCSTRRGLFVVVEVIERPPFVIFCVFSYMFPAHRSPFVLLRNGLPFADDRQKRRSLPSALEPSF
jgi:hypothetical protein